MATLVSRPAAQNVEQANYHHFVMDIAWFGLALAATSRFIQFYALELGAGPMELGWITSLPSLVLMVSTAFSMWWRGRFRDSTAAILLPGIGFRFVFLLPVFAPFFPEDLRPAWIVLSATLPALPQGIAATVFIVMMRETIEPEHVQPLVTRRTLALNIAVTLGALAFGFLLERLPFPQNYQVMFLAAYGLSLVSMWHVAQVRQLERPVSSPTAKTIRQRPWLEVFKSPAFRAVVLVTFLTHMAYFFNTAAPQPLRLKNDLGASEGFIALFGMLEVISAALVTLRMDTWRKSYGNHRLIAAGMAATALSSLMMATAPALWFMLPGAVLSGAGWTVTAIAVIGYFTERTEANDYQATTVWHQVIFFGMFVGPMVSSSLAQIGFSPVFLLLVGAGLRLGTGLVTLVADARNTGR